MKKAVMHLIYRPYGTLSQPSINFLPICCPYGTVQFGLHMGRINKHIFSFIVLRDEIKFCVDNDKFKYISEESA